MNIPKRYKSHKTYTFCALSKVYSKREILTDSQLNEVYSAILDIPELKLNSDHIESLKKRGLTESEIDIFGYRTMPEYLYFPKGKDWSFKLWDRSNFEDIYFRFLNLKK